ncbi:ankyrin repeat domain-containing protein [Aquimarina sp. MMG016]|uniref:ankyrin repeat domain-containing protein n=1 Tax=Aquimarina sp. MMG016 TaxID=2822690 RepID=UPI001B39E761|nr:ankyrin repeat domain-containing protein [Aquimarina sp. MMG016]MBQ4822275.1 ankyrin repeat domain-containing protein [Aquimarina sp. MMG016]
MRKIVLFTLTALLVSSASFALENNMTVDSHTYEFVANNQTSPFCMAIVKGDTETVKKLIELGTDVNKKSNGMTPLMYAARYNRVDIIKVLVEKGAKIKTKNEKGYNAMKFAKLSNAKEAMALLKELS